MKNSAERELGSLAAVRDGSGPASWGEGSWHQSDVKKYPTTIAEFNELESLIAFFEKPEIICGNFCNSLIEYPCLTLSGQYAR